MNPNLPPLATVRAQVTDWLTKTRAVTPGALTDSMAPAVEAMRGIERDVVAIVMTLHEGLTDAEAERDALRARAEAALATARAEGSAMARHPGPHRDPQEQPMSEPANIPTKEGLWFRRYPGLLDHVVRVCGPVNDAGRIFPLAWYREDHGYDGWVGVEDDGFWIGEVRVDDVPAEEAARLRARAEAAEAALATARAEGVAAERAAIVSYLRDHREVADRAPGWGVDAGPNPTARRFALRVCEDIAAGTHVRPVEGA